MRVGYLTTYDSADVRNWSGLGYFIRRGLEQAGCRVLPVGPLTRPSSLAIQAKRTLHRFAPVGTYIPERDPRVGRAYAAQAEAILRSADVDLVFSPGTIPIAYITISQPLVFWTDATFAAMRGFYPGFFNLSKTTIQAGQRMEQLALDRADLALYSSEWAAASAREDYGANPAKVKVVPFGANLEDEPAPDAITRFIETRPADRCRLLFMGVEWERKGGDVAVEVVRELNQSGLPTTMSVIGCDPAVPADLRHCVDVIGFVDKGTAAGSRQIESELERAHFLILPSQADCSPLVLCEANAYGVPSVTTDVGGIPTIVRDGVNGIILEGGAPPASFAEAILERLSPRESYRRLALASYAEYRSRLNWAASGQRVAHLLEKLLVERQGVGLAP